MFIITTASGTILAGADTVRAAVYKRDRLARAFPGEAFEIHINR